MDAETVNIKPLVLKLEALFADGVQAEDFPKAAIICAAEAETLGKVLHLSGQQKMQLVLQAFEQVLPAGPELDKFKATIPILIQGAVLASKLHVQLAGGKPLSLKTLLCCA